jgi:plastocyanin
MVSLVLTIRTRSIGVAVFVGLLVLGGCGDDSSDSSDTTTGAGGTAGAAATTVAEGANTLTIKDLTFSALTVKAGDTISIVNEDSFRHTVTADDGSFDVDVPAGATATLLIPEAGSYAIHCKVHASMHGTIVVN